MGKTEMCIRMLEILNSGKSYKKEELADLLETNKRNIIEYKNELAEAGYYIDFTPGRYGGYKLESKCLFPALKLDLDEKEAIKDSFEYLSSKQEFLNKKAYQLAMGKIISSFNHDYEVSPLRIIEKEDIIFDSKDIEDKYNLIKECINNNLIIKFDYINNKNKVIERTVEPYDLYVYNSGWFVLGYCQELKDYRYFKLIRISNLVNTRKKFSRDYFFNPADYFDDTGKKKNDEWFDVKLKIKGYPLVKIQEQRIGKNQKITYISNQEAILEAQMQYRVNIISFVLGLGCNCEVIEPEWLKDDIIKSLNDTLKIYE